MNWYPQAEPPTPTSRLLAQFDWSGFYVGVYGGYNLLNTYAQAGGQAGFNILRGALLAGVELQLGAASGGGGIFEAYLNGRAGAVLGDRLLLYAEGGVGTFSGSLAWTAGAGGEIAIGGSISVFAEAEAFFTSGFEGSVLQAGINFHPGN